jgi:DoxX-like family
MSATFPKYGPAAPRAIGWTMTALVGAFIAFDASIKLLVIRPVVDSFQQMGFPVSLARGLGVLELVILVLYLMPRTAVLGAILLTGLLGGAVASHLRLLDPLFSHVLFGVYVGVLAWGGLYLRDEQLRRLLPIRS